MEKNTDYFWTSTILEYQRDLKHCRRAVRFFKARVRTNKDAEPYQVAVWLQIIENYQLCIGIIVPALNDLEKNHPIG